MQKNVAPHGLSHDATYTAEQLLNGAKELMIRHAQDIYVLRLTKQNKLILTKLQHEHNSGSRLR